MFCGTTGQQDQNEKENDNEIDGDAVVKANMALSMFPGHSHSPRPYSTAPHSPAAAASVAATAAAAAAHGSSYFGYGYHPHQQQFSGIGGISPYAYSHLTSADLNSNLNYAAAGFAAGSAFSDPALAAQASAAPGASGAGSHSPTTWHSSQWPTHAANSPFSSATCRSSAYGPSIDAWSPSAEDLQPQPSGADPVATASNAEHSPTDHQQQQNESGNSGTSSGPTGSSSVSSVPPPANSASPTPFSAARGASPGADNNNPVPAAVQPYSNNNGGDLFPKNFIHGSPTYTSKSDHLAATSTPPPSSSSFGLPACITVTSQNLPPLAAAPDGHALSPGSLSPGNNGFSAPTLLGGAITTSSSRPQPARSPYEWMKKPSYQSQPEKNGHQSAEGSSSPWQADHLDGGAGGGEGEEDEVGGRTRTKDKYRVVYSDHQRLELEKEFHYSRYITIRRKAELASNVGLSERQVKIWFQNRRAKERRALKKQDDIMTKDKLEAAAASTLAMSAFNETLTHAHLIGAAAATQPPPPPPGAAPFPPSSSPAASAAAVIAASAASQIAPPPPHPHLSGIQPPHFMKFE